MTLVDTAEVERLMIEYCRSEPLSVAVGTQEMEQTTIKLAKARPVMVMCLCNAVHFYDIIIINFLKIKKKQKKLEKEPKKLN